MRILMLGDIVGRPGREIVKEILPQIDIQYNPDLVIANGENAAGGFGLSRAVAHELFNIGIGVLTSGNHIWDQKEIYDYLDDEPRVLRPANYPPGVPGNSVYYAKVGSETVAVVNLIGRVFMGDYDCPFRSMDTILSQVREQTNHIIVDFHAEATSEKLAFAWYVTSKVSAVVGTHTHVPTSDQRILPGKTAYTTDLGMCGPLDGILGVERETVIKKFIYQLPSRFSVAKGATQMCGVLIDLDRSGKAQKISRIYYEKNIV